MISYTHEVGVPVNINQGLSANTNGRMISMLGEPRSSYDQECRPVTNKKLAARIITENVGPFRVTGFDLAVRSLKPILAEIKQKYPDMKLGSAGMLCARRVRGSTTAISNHSWGCAVDLTIDGKLDDYGDGKVQHGLTLIYPIFNKHKWLWGAHFRKEDGMHFEVSWQLLGAWKEQGLLP
jgi:hypothetical protein